MRGLSPLFILLAALTNAQPAYAETQPDNAALVVSIDAPARGTICQGAAARVTHRLQAEGATVTALSNATNIQLRVALDRLNRTATAPTAIYLCGHVIDDSGRLFLLPADFDPASGASLPVQAVLLKAAFDPALHHGGVIMGDLRVAAQGDGAHIADDLKTLFSAGGGDLRGMIAYGDEKTGTAPMLANIIDGDIRALSWDATIDFLRAHASGIALFLRNPPVTVLSPPPPPPPSPAPAPAPLQTALPSPAQPAPDPFPLASAPPDRIPPAASDRRDSKDDARHEPHGHMASVADNQRIARLQIALHARGLYNGAVTGVENPAFRDAIRAFQNAAGHRSSGRLTSAEIILLLSGR